MKQGFFITGTDTGIGKTRCAATLMHYFRQQRLSVIGMKPVASGCRVHEGRLKSEDALILQQQATVPMPYELVNPYAFELPVSVHIGASLAGITIDISVIQDHVEVLKRRADVLIVEAVGGWMAPLNTNNDVSDLANALQLPVILVISMRLGCINHAKLTYNAINAKGLSCAGWIANCTQPDLLFIDENILTIQSTIDAPLLGILPFSPVPDYFATSQYISFR